MKKIRLIVLIALSATTFYYTGLFYKQTATHQEAIYLDLESKFFSTQELISNILNSCEAIALELKSIKDPNLLKAQISNNLMGIAVLDAEKKFLYGWEMDVDQHEIVSPITSTSIPVSKNELGWLNIDLNSRTFTCRSYYMVQREDQSYLLLTYILIPAIDSMAFLSFGFHSFPYVAYDYSNTITSSLNFSKPTVFERLIDSSIFLQTPVVNNWLFVFSGKWSDLYPYSIPEIHFLFYLILLWGGTLTFSCAFLLNASLKKASSLWITSLVFDSFCLILIVFLFMNLPAHYTETNERTSSFRKLEGFPKERAILIPTAFYLESLGFPNDSSFVISGFISQIYPKHTEIEVGFLFPNESIQYPATVTEISKWENSHSTTILWHFSVGLSHSFPPLFFPFDTRRIPIDLWPKEVHKDIVFFPNFLNYHNVSMQNLMSIDSNVNPIGWSIRNSTYLLIGTETYDFFGFSHLPISFQYTVSLQRDFLGAFLSNILVLTLCMLVAFLVLFIPPDSLLNSLFATISIFVGLIFIAVTNHASLHTNLQASSFAYCEFLFISFYVLILAITVDFIFRIGDPNPNKTTLLLRSVCYWPLLLGSFVFAVSISIL